MQGVLALYSVTNGGHLGQVEDSLKLVRQTKETDDRDAPIILLGNKLDLPTERAIVPAQGKQLADQFAVYSRSIASDNKTAKQKNKNKNKKTTTIKNDDDGQCFRFVRNFFECSVKENSVIDYHPRFFATECSRRLRRRACGRCIGTR
jgi:GTPase SAR1 family protein